MTLKSDGRQLLKGISGNFPPASLVALMGPSGSGKTTFMNALLGRASYGNITGDVIVNGTTNGLQAARNLVGFVPQDDIVHEDLTVWQNILFSARQRLPATIPYSVVKKHCQAVVNTLGLSHVQNMLVGSPKKRGISGGQKKRVNIGIELAAMPSIVFMDEPTSGLDGAATLELAQCLAELRKSGLTIICVIHQPRFTVFKEFSHLLLLGAGGQMVYGGRTENVTSYLISLGFRMPELDNPADWMIDVVCGLQPRYLEDGQVDSTFEAPENLFVSWRELGHAKSCMDPGSKFNRPAPPAEIMAKCIPLQIRSTPGFCRQWSAFTERQWNKFDIQAFAGKCAALWIAAAMLGSIQGAASYSYRSLYQSLAGPTNVLAMFCSIQSHSLIFDESLVAFREFKSGMNSSSYFMAKLIYDLLCTTLYACFWVFSYYIQATPFQGLAGTGYFWIFLGYCFWWSSFGGWVATTFNNYTTGLLILVFLPAIEQLWSGVKADALDQDPIRDRIGSALFMSTMSSGRWLNQGLYSSEILSLPEHVRDFPGIKETLYNISVTSESLDSQSSVSSEELVWGQQQAGIALFCLGLMFRALTWGSIMLTKFSQGQTRRSQFKFLICACLEEFHLSCAASDDLDEEDVRQPQVPTSVFRREYLGSILGENPRWNHVRDQVRHKITVERLADEARDEAEIMQKKNEDYGCEEKDSVDDSTCNSGEHMALEIDVTASTN